MKFNAVVGNPPYQIMDGGAQASSSPIYNYFVESSKKITSQYVSMIMPSRWMIGGKGLDQFRDSMIHDRRVEKLYDFLDGKEIFNNVDIKGGICYFLFNKEYNGKCSVMTITNDEVIVSNRYLADEKDDIFIRFDVLVQIKKKIQNSGRIMLDSIVSARKPYGLEAETMLKASKYNLPNFSNTPIKNGYEIFGLGEKAKRTWKYIPNNYPLPKISPCLMKYKVFIAEAYGCGAIGEVPSTPGQLCTETFLEIGPFETKIEAENMIKYIKTKFFRCLVGIQKQTQHTTKKAYRFVPMINLKNNEEIDWSKSVTEIDNQLFNMFDFNDKEVKFINSNIKDM